MRTEELIRAALEHHPDSMSPTQLAEARAKTLNETAGSMPGEDCPICRNKGYVALVDGLSVYTSECSCVARRRMAKRIRESGLEDLMQTYTMDAYRAERPWQRDVKRKAIAFVDEPGGEWLFVAGTPGTGKTHICTAVCKLLVSAGKEVRYMLWRDEAPRLKAMVNDRDAYERHVRDLKRVDVLYIDDFFKGTVTDADINLAFEILNARYNSRRLATIISTEKSIERLLEIDEAIGSRIYERSKRYCILTPEENWRLR